MKVSLEKVKALRLRLKRENEKGRSWRVIAQEDYGEKKLYSTLNKIVLRKGKWWPKDEKVLLLLGLIVPRSPYASMPSYFHRTPEALDWFNHKKQLVKDLSNASRRMTKGKS